MATRRRLMSEINVVPYIDVMLVLLVIFMITAPLLSQGIKVDLPKNPSNLLEEAQDDPLVVSIREDGVIFLNVGSLDPNEEGSAVSSDELLDQAKKVLTVRPSVPVFIRGDQSLSYGTVVDIMSVLQNAGAASVGLITEPPEI